MADMKCKMLKLAVLSGERCNKPARNLYVSPVYGDVNICNEHFALSKRPQFEAELKEAKDKHVEGDRQ